MEQSQQINYNAYNAPSAPATNFNAYNTPSAPAPNFNQQTHQGNVIYHHTTGTHPVFVDSGFQSNFNEKPGFVPPQQPPINTFPTFVPSQPYSNDSYCGQLHRNRRQTSSVAGG